MPFAFAEDLKGGRTGWKHEEESGGLKDREKEKERDEGGKKKKEKGVVGVDRYLGGSPISETITILLSVVAEASGSGAMTGKRETTDAGHRRGHAAPRVRRGERGALRASGSQERPLPTLNAVLMPATTGLPPPTYSGVRVLETVSRPFLVREKTHLSVHLWPSRFRVSRADLPFFKRCFWRSLFLLACNRSRSRCFSLPLRPSVFLFVRFSFRTFPPLTRVPLISLLCALC